MELENKKFRCHVSIIFEECATFIVSAVVLAIVNIGDLFDEDMTSSDSLYAVLALVGLIFAVTLIILLRALFRWRKTTITIDRESIVWERNTLNKKKLTIGINHISSINVERNIFERIIGTAKLKIDTSSLSTAAETDVTFLFKHEEALYYKEYLESMVRAMSGEAVENEAEEGDSSESTGENVVGAKSVLEAKAKSSSHANQKVTAEFVTKEGEIIMHCIYTISMFAVVIGLIPTIFGVVEIVSILSSGKINIGELLGMVTFVITVGYATFYSVIGKLFRLYGLKVTRKGNQLHMKYGLLKIREYIIPVEKINAIHINQTLIGRLFHRYDATMECVGVGDENNEIAQLTLALPYEEVIHRVSKLLPEYEVAQIEQAEKISAKAFWHKLKGFFIFTFIWVCFMIGVFLAADGAIDTTFVAIAIAVIVLFYGYIALSIVLQLKTEATSFGEKHLIVVTGTFGKDIMLVPYKKIQHVMMSHSPIGKWTGLVLGNIFILAAGAGTIKKLPYITEDKVEILKEKMCER